MAIAICSSFSVSLESTSTLAPALCSLDDRCRSLRKMEDAFPLGFD
ncbi:hypothetical protein [Altericista sp. CCNU0014]